MKIKILDIKEEGDILRVKTECDYGEDDLGLSLESKKADPITGKPQWQLEVRDLLEKKYKNAKKAEKKDLKEYVGKEI